ncbi:MAG TPA: transcriptional regulator [Thermoanaerobaculia bacterium]
MKLREKLARLRTLEGFARGLGRELTQTEVVRGVREELDGRISQSYLSQLESGARLHLTSGTRLLLARYFKVHPGYLVDDHDDAPPLPPKQRRELDDRLDLWLIEGSETFSGDRELSEALLQIAKHEKSRDCLVLFGSIVENRQLIDHLVETLELHPKPVRKRRKS